MPTLTEAMVEVGDCHTSFYHLGPAPPQNPPLLLGTAADYTALYAKVAAPQPVTYQSLTGNPGVLLNKLSPAFRDNKYWGYFFGVDEPDQYLGNVWKLLAPIRCSVTLRVDFPSGGKSKLTVSPQPDVILYPFGWTNCLSLRVRGEFQLQDLADFNESLFAKKLFTIPNAAGQPVDASVWDVFRSMSKGVRADAFGGALAGDFAPKQPIIVTTIMESHSGNLTLDGLSSSEEQALLRIVKPEPPPPSGNLSDYVHRLPDPKYEKYVVMVDYGRFTWMEDRLLPEDRNYQHLRCNHNNTFNSLVHARHLYQLLTDAVNQNALSPSLTEVAAQANRLLGLPSLYYKSASLRGFLNDPKVAAARQAMADKLSEKKTN
jgi:hypothetical protein